MNKKKDIWYKNIKDYRFIPFGFAVIYALIFLFSDIYLGGKSVIGQYLSTGAYDIHFNDLWTLLSGVDAIRDGLNPYTNSGNPWEGVDGFSKYNYPITWGFLAVFPFISASNHIYIGCFIAIALFVAFYFFMGKINLFESVCYTTMLLSPAVLMGFERGNCDLIILLFLFIPIFLKRSKIVLSIFVLFTGMLKLFPIGAIIAILESGKNKLKKEFLLSFLVGILFIIYLVIMKENISIVSEKTPRPDGGWSIGLGGIPSFTFNLIKSSKTLIFLIYFVLLITGIVLFFRLTYKKISLLQISSDRKGISFLIGAGIFLTTCIIGYNWEYRMIWLLLTFPQLLDWIAKNKSSVAMNMIILAILISWYNIFFSYGYITRNIYSLQMNRFFLVYSRHLLIIILFYNYFFIVFGFIINYFKKLIPSIIPYLKK